MTTPMTFTKAVKEQEKLRLALDGPTGAGKTWTALTLATTLAGHEGGRIALIDSERSSAKKYAKHFDFDHLTLPDFDPRTYTAAVRSAIDAGYAVLIVDSLSHAWEGTLDMKDRVSRKSQSGDSFGAWREVTPVHNELVDTLLRAPMHVIATMRVETEYLVDPTNPDRSKRVQKIGLKPVQRKGVDYEFDVVCDMDQENTLVVSKSRCPEISGAVIHRPDVRLAETLWEWLQDGEPVVPTVTAAGLLARMNALAEEPRKACKEQFKDTFGRPEQLLVSKLAAANDLIASFEATQSPPPIGGDGPASPTIGDTGAEEQVPPPSAPAAAKPKKSDAQKLHIEAGKIEGVGEAGLDLVILNLTGGASSSANALDARMLFKAARSLSDLAGMDLEGRQEWLGRVRDATTQQEAAAS